MTDDCEDWEMVQSKTIAKLRQDNERLSGLLRKAIACEWLCKFWATSKSQDFKSEIKEAINVDVH